VDRFVRGADDGHDRAGAVEGRVQAAVRVVPRQGEVIFAAAVPAVAGRDDLAGAVDGNAVDFFLREPDGGRDDAGAVEGGVQAAVCVVACQGEPVVAAIVGRVAGGDDLAGAVDGHAPDLVLHRPNGGRDDAATEGRVQAAVHVVPRQGKVEFAAVAG